MTTWVWLLYHKSEVIGVFATETAARVYRDRLIKGYPLDKQNDVAWHLVMNRRRVIGNEDL